MEKKTIKVNGTTFENVTEKMENWLKADNMTIENVTEKTGGKPTYLVRQMYMADGVTMMTKGQKTLLALTMDDGKIVFRDKTALKTAFGMTIKDHATTCAKTEKTDLQKLYSLISKIVENDLVKGDKETENDIINIVERLADKVDEEKKEIEKKTKDEALKNDLLSRGFSEAEIAAILAGPKKK